MSKYTTQVRYICETRAGLTESEGLSSVDTIITTAAPLIFEEFPIFDESYRLPLEKLILRHYYTQEIAYETVGLWTLHLNNRMNEIMPYYNKLYVVQLLDIDPTLNVNYTIEYEGSRAEQESTAANHDISRSNSSQSSGNSSVNTTNRHSDTPQGALTGLESNDYMSDATLNDQTSQASSSDSGSSSETGNNTGSKSGSTSDEHTQTIRGKYGNTSYASMISQYMNMLRNVDQMVINELQDLFMGVW